jgi:hypothetical protein
MLTVILKCCFFFFETNQCNISSNGCSLSDKCVFCHYPVWSFSCNILKLVLWYLCYWCIIVRHWPNCISCSYYVVMQNAYIASRSERICDHGLWNVSTCWILEMTVEMRWPFWQTHVLKQLEYIWCWCMVCVLQFSNMLEQNHWLFAQKNIVSKV